MAILASWLIDIFTAYKKPGIFAVSCVMAYRQGVGIFKHVGFLPYVRRSVNSRYIRRRTIVRLWVMGVQWIWDYCWHIAGIFADILAWRRIYQEYVGVFRLQCLNWRKTDGQIFKFWPVITILALWAIMWELISQLTFSTARKVLDSFSQLKKDCWPFFKFWPVMTNLAITGNHVRNIFSHEIFNCKKTLGQIFCWNIGKQTVLA